MVDWLSVSLPLWDDDEVAEQPVISTPTLTPASALPPWARRVGVFDLETTGVDVTHDRIVTAHVGVLDHTGEVVSARSWIADPGIDIPAGATAVHGITTEYARAHGRPARDVVADVVDDLRRLFDLGIPVVAYNAPYDFSLLKYEALRHGLAPIASPSPVVDPLVLDKTYDRYRKGKRTLEVVAAHYAVTLEGAHDASADAVAAGRVAQALAARYALSHAVEELHTQQIGWARSQAESLTEYFISVGRLSPEDALDGSWPIR
ncbi:MAG: exonuclease domain-containing protein [Candidatus Microbacterium phytovorans]|uniref:Exonuclease domain-containing protein n=1 Tax=Candidatus Microbacterium phytovorans TaxID=3121374 RepID=A0AAJ5W1Y1_9MICO|nr:exonuclease domain-containing protein [Microbacterium sp.]WEK14247.1 MAG: exonuclease domain-containing protein [Microbacterium sp.]